MALIDLNALAQGLPQAWKSRCIAQAGTGNIKVLRMNGLGFAQETHDYNEGLLVLSGVLILAVEGQTIRVEQGHMYLAEAGTAHAVLPGSWGTLVIIDV